MTYLNVEALPDAVAGQPHRAVSDRLLEQKHVAKLMENFKKSKDPNKKIQWVGWLKDPKEPTSTHSFGLGDVDNDLVAPPPFVDVPTLKAFQALWTEVGLIE